MYILIELRKVEPSTFNCKSRAYASVVKKNVEKLNFGKLRGQNKSLTYIFIYHITTRQHLPFIKSNKITAKVCFR